MISGQRVLITGGAGFIGSHLTERLLVENHVVIYDNFRRDALRETSLDTRKLTVIRGDVMDRENLKRAMEGCDSVVHMASIAGVDTVLRNPVKTMRTAMVGTDNALEVAREHGEIKRFIDFSTSEVFGRFAYHVTEFDSTTLGAVGEARWTYAVAKLATEHLAMNYHKEFDLPTCSIRPFNVYGPRQVGEGAVHHFIRQAIAGENLTIHNEGAQIRAWCYIDDIVDAVMLCLSKDGAIGHAFNIGNARSTLTIYNLAELIIRLTKSTSELNLIEWPNTDVEVRVPNANKAKELLEFCAVVNLEEGLLRTIDWYRKQMGAAAFS